MKQKKLDAALRLIQEHFNQTKAPTYDQKITFVLFIAEGRDLGVVTNVAHPAAFSLAQSGADNIKKQMLQIAGNAAITKAARGKRAKTKIVQRKKN